MIRFTFMLFGLLLLASCSTPLIKIDSADYVQNPGSYKEPNTLIVAHIADIVGNYDLYKGKKVEVTAPVVYVAENDPPRRYMVLKENGKELRCYEEDYQHIVRSEVVHQAKKAKQEGGEITVRGSLRDEGIELKQIAYRDFVFNTDYTEVEKLFRWKAGQPAYNYFYQ
jgi:hypothetical protein